MRWSNEGSLTYSEFSKLVRLDEDFRKSLRLVLCPPNRLREIMEIFTLSCGGELNHENTIVCLPGLFGNDVSYVESRSGVFRAVRKEKVCS